MLHTLYGKSLRHDTTFFIEYFALDLILENGTLFFFSHMYYPGACRGFIALNMEDGTIHQFRSHKTELATGGYDRAYFSCSLLIHVLEMVMLWLLELVYRSKIWNLFNSIQLVSIFPLLIAYSLKGVYGAGCLITEGSRGEGGYLLNSKGTLILFLIKE